MTTAVLSLERLVKRFGGLTATDHVSLDLYPGEIHALIGPNGAGKSTLMNQIAGELRPDSGHITLAGHDVTHVPAAERVRLGLGRTFQITTLLDAFTVIENLATAVQAKQGGNFCCWDRMTRRRSVWQEAEARLAGTTLELRAGARAADLSHGERKQLELTMALALQPRALLLDEPMAGLGRVESQEMIRAIAALRKETAMLLVEHDMDAVFTLADRVSVLVYGRIVAGGSVADIRDNPLVREAYLGAEEELC